MATFWVSEPYMSLRLEDEPLAYQASRGPRVAFHLSYRQRGPAPETSYTFGVGNNWSCSFRSYIIDTGGSPDMLWLNRAGASYIKYTNGVTQYIDGSIATAITGGYQIVYRDGSKDTFTTSFRDLSLGTTIYLITTQADPSGNALTYTYSSASGAELLSTVTDPDGRVTTLYYENASFPSQITKVVDPYSRTNLLKYDSSGYLTNITDVAGLTSSFMYDAGNPGWITNLTTGYGSTGFSYGGADVASKDFNTTGNVVNRWVQVVLPTGGTHLYLFRQDCSGFMSTTYASVPSTSPLANTLDNVDQENRNSFHWNPLQYAALSTTDPNALSTTDYGLGRLHHWLADPSSADASGTLSVSRAASPDKVATGQLRWYDYGGKSSGNNYMGTNGLPSFVAMVLPDGSSRYIHYARNPQNKVTQTIDTYSKTDGSIGLRTNSYAYAANNIDLLQQIGPNGEQVVSNYFSAGNVYHQPDATYDALNQQTAYTYNANRQIMKISWPSGLTTTNIYFSSGSFPNWLSTTIDLEIYRTNSYTYANGLVSTHSDDRGLSTTNSYDNLQRLTQVLYPDGSTISNRYLNLDRTALKDRDGYWTYFSYNSLRQKLFETNANNVVTAYGYCSCGVLSSMTNALGTAVQQVTSYNYDYQGNLTYVYLPDETVTNWFNSLAQRTVTSDGWGYHTNAYNNQGLLTNTSDFYGVEQGTIYDNENRPLYVTDDRGVTITNTYDVLGRVVIRGYPDTGLERFGYSARGLVAYTNQIGKVSSYGYDAGGRKTSETNANPEIISYVYTNGLPGDLISLTDGKLQTTKWGYDSFGRVTNKIDQAGAVILRYTYDADDRLLSRWSSAKGTTYYTNDPVGNLTYIKYPASTSVSLQYDSLNRLTNMVDAAGTTKYTYTSGNQLLTEIQPFSSSTVTNVYVNRLRTMLNLQQPTGLWTNAFSYDVAGRLTNVTSPAGSIGWTLATPGPRLIRKVSLPNTSYITNTYDSVARLTGTYLDNSANSVLDSAVYGYNQANQRTAFTNAAGTYVQYTYDNIGQLTIATSSASTETRGYGYDTAWNLHYITNSAGGVSTFSVDGKNQLTTDGPSTYSYDSNGNLSSRNNSGGLQSYTYDDENRLVSVVLGTTFNTAFTYDGLGRLRKRIEYTWNGQSWVANTTTEYIYDGMRVLQERDVNNTPTVSYTRGIDLSGSLEGAGGIGGLLARSSGYSGGNWSTHYFYHADGNGNITYLVDGSQALAASYRYGPYGIVTSSSGPMASANLYRFSSKEVHLNTGMYGYLYRLYDPNLVRWINRDPVDEVGFEVIRARAAVLISANSYTFVGNEPTDSIDPFGLQKPPIISTLFPPPTTGNPFTCQLASRTEPIKGDPGPAGSNHNGQTACIWRCNRFGDQPATQPPTTTVTFAPPNKPCPPPRDPDNPKKCASVIPPGAVPPALQFPVYE